MQRVFRSLTVIAALHVCACMGLAQKGTLLEAQEHYSAGRYEAAIDSASMALNYKVPTPEIDAQVAFLKAESLEALGRYREAAQLYRYLITVHRESALGYQAAGRLEFLQNQAGIPIGTAATPLPDDPQTDAVPNHVVIDRPWLLEPAEIFYPRSAEVAGQEGFVTIRLVSNPEGTLSSYKVIDSSHPIFEDAVVGALPSFRFNPDGFGDSEEPYTRTIRLRFRLE